MFFIEVSADLLDESFFFEVSADLPDELVFIEVSADLPDESFLFAAMTDRLLRNIQDMRKHQP
ncbi:MAG: hypothetical protein LBJ64_00505 [Deltaproteobacteria bacterium]|nr:hypothetical protein [Deltaproteobacteria bacterium]